MDGEGGGCEDYEEGGFEVDEEGLLSETACPPGDGDGEVREENGGGRRAREDDEEGNRDAEGKRMIMKETTMKTSCKSRRAIWKMKGRWRRTSIVNEDT